MKLIAKPNRLRVKSTGIKKKRLLVFFVAILLAAALTNVKTSSSNIATLSLDPRIIHEVPGESFKVNVTVSGVDFLYAWQVNMSFNPEVLTFVNVTEGEFLVDQPEGTFGVLNIQEGYALFGWSTIGEYVGESGSGTLATVEFKVLKEGESLITFETEPYYVPGKTEPLDPTYLTAQNSPNPPPDFDDLEFTAQNGFFTNTVTPPVAKFTYPSNPGINERITFDASASSATPPLEIMEYYWDFDDGTNATSNTPTVNHTYTTGGNFTVSLTVIDNATASTLVQSQFNTTDQRASMGFMPRIWYELFSTCEALVGITFPHNIAVTNVVPSKMEVTAGETISITVTVLNKGTETEDFDVTVYYDTNEIDTKQVVDLKRDEEETLTFDWGTTGVAEGGYPIKALASPVEGETSVDDNEFLDGTVTVNAASESFPTTLVIAGVVGVGVILVILVLYMRKKSTSST